LCVDNATCSQLIPIISILVNGLSLEVDKQANEAFRADLDEMLTKCRALLRVSLNNNFLKVSSMLDPRYTVQMESLLGQKFKSLLPTFIELVNRFRKQDYLPDEHSLINEDVNVSEVETQQYDF